jgi:trehalose 6-phosphate phosphatase
VKNILARAQREVLEQLAWSNVLVGFDFDGTLAPIRSDPGSVELSRATRALLGELAELYPTVVISGRSLRDVERRLAGIPLRGVVGNHGLEPWRAADELRTTVEGWKRRLSSALQLPGIELEDKTYSLAIHYRRSRQKKLALATIAKALGALGEVRVIGGKQVVNVLPPGAPHKGVALERERDRLGCDTALYVGDDETDEDVFSLERPGRLVTVRVGAASASQASYCLRRQAAIDELMFRLIELRRTRVSELRRAR